MLRTDIDMASVYQREGKYEEALPIFMKALQYDKERNIYFEGIGSVVEISGYELEGKI